MDYELACHAHSGNITVQSNGSYFTDPKPENLLFDFIDLTDSDR